VLLVHGNASQPKTLVRFNLQVYCTVDDIYCVPPKLLLFVVTQLTGLAQCLKTRWALCTAGRWELNLGDSAMQNFVYRLQTGLWDGYSQLYVHIL